MNSLFTRARLFATTHTNSLGHTFPHSRAGRTMFKYTNNCGQSLIVGKIHFCPLQICCRHFLGKACNANIYDAIGQESGTSGQHFSTKKQIQSIRHFPICTHMCGREDGKIKTSSTSTPHTSQLCCYKGSGKKGYFLGLRPKPVTPAPPPIGAFRTKVLKFTVSRKSFWIHSIKKWSDITSPFI